MSQKFYGCLPKLVLPGQRQFARYMLAAAAALAIPTQIYWQQALAPGALQMYDNDKAGCCTFAAVGNLIITQSANAGSPVTPDPAAILAGYVSATGYNPQTGANDTGCAETTVLDTWKTSGIAGNTASAWTEVDPKNLDHLRIGCWYFGGAYLGLTVTAEAEQQFDAGQPWERGWWNNPVGAHAVPLLGYDANYLYVGTWAKCQPMTWDYWSYFGSEAYVVIDKSFLKSTGVSPVGLDLDQMLADQSAVAA